MIYLYFREQLKLAYQLNLSTAAVHYTNDVTSLSRDKECSETAPECVFGQTFTARRKRSMMGFRAGGSGKEKEVLGLEWTVISVSICSVSSLWLCWAHALLNDTHVHWLLSFEFTRFIWKAKYCHVIFIPLSFNRDSKLQAKVVVI